MPRNQIALPALAAAIINLHAKELLPSQKYISDMLSSGDMILKEGIKLYIIFRFHDTQSQRERNSFLVIPYDHFSICNEQVQGLGTYPSTVFVTYGLQLIDEAITCIGRQKSSYNLSGNYIS